jgi:hypothetical protein
MNPSQDLVESMVDHQKVQTHPEAQTKIYTKQEGSISVLSSRNGTIKKSSQLSHWSIE